MNMRLNMHMNMNVNTNMDMSMVVCEDVVYVIHERIHIRL